MKHNARQFEIPIPDEPFALVGEKSPPPVLPEPPRPDNTPELFADEPPREQGEVA